MRIVVASCHDTVVPAISKPSPWKNFAVNRCSVGAQIQFARPIRPASSEIDTTSFVASLAPCRLRMMTTSMNAPNSGAAMSNTKANAIGAGHPHSKRSCQYVNAPIMPMAPCAKLKIPVVV
jgi:hypothetical protein